MMRAFLLGAGLGTRLRPLTWHLPNPLIPFRNSPLLDCALGHLAAAGTGEFVINTHHLPEAYPSAYPDAQWQGKPIHFRHEPVVLETGGGLANVRDLLDGPESFFVYNGDVLTDLPLAPALQHHRTSGNLVTLILRSSGPVRNVAMDRATGRLVDVRNARGTNHPDLFQFTGLYLVHPEFFRWLPPAGTVESVVHAWLRAIDSGAPLGGYLADEGLWLDLGDRASYLASHRLSDAFPAWRTSPEPISRIHPDARVHASAIIDATSSVAADATVGSGADLHNTIVWRGGMVAPGARLSRCVVLPNSVAEGCLMDADI
jgi:mannose-1-phosphate guanylyltransferase/mannose-1-phosphate guanylyltransferase/phosphomannomutase